MLPTDFIQYCELEAETTLKAHKKPPKRPASVQPAEATANGALLRGYLQSLSSAVNPQTRYDDYLDADAREARRHHRGR